jgi:CoA:oxalate CoA-transferase
MEAKTKTFKLKDLQKALDDVGVPNGPIWSVAQALTSEQASALEMIQEIDHPTCGKIKVTGIPVKLSQTPGMVALSPPTLGQHTEEILMGVLGYSKTEVERLRKEKVV